VLDCKTEHLEGLHFNWQSDMAGLIDFGRHYWNCINSQKHMELGLCLQDTL